MWNSLPIHEMYQERNRMIENFRLICTAFSLIVLCVCVVLTLTVL